MNPTTVITGTTHGIGRVTVRELAQAGHRLVMLCRNVAAANQVCAELLPQPGNASVQVVECDLASLDSVRTAAAQVLKHCDAIHVLINNAGTVSMRHRLSVDGFELTFATNHLGPFLLTELLRPHIVDNGRIINVASVAHQRGTLDLGNVINPKARYFSVRAYAQSKLANVLHTFALARRSHDVSVTCLHPGIVDSNLLPRWVRLIKPWFTPVTFDIERGARTTLQLALTDNIHAFHGCYVDEHGQIQPASKLANDVALQEALWAASEQWTAKFR